MKLQGNIGQVNLLGELDCLLRGEGGRLPMQWWGRDGLQQVSSVRRRSNAGSRRDEGTK